MNGIKKWMIELYKELNSFDKKIYLMFSVISFIIVSILYFTNFNWYLQYDKIYSLDSGWCVENIIPDYSYYDIRHPILSIFTFPIYTILSTIIGLFFSGSIKQCIIVICFQFINIQLLLIIGILLKDLTKNKNVFLTYMISFSSILYIVFFEKYILCVFFVVLYVYNICKKKENENILSLSFAFGCMPTSGFIGILEFMNSKTFKEKIYRILKIIFVTLIIFICLGRVKTIVYGFSEMLEKKSTYSSNNYTLIERIISTTKMLQTIFIQLPLLNKSTDCYWWDSVTSNISVISLVILSIVIIGICVNWKELFVKICTMWTLFSFILFVVLKWAVQESPLFIIYFSWAVIPLFIMGLEYILSKIKINNNVVCVMMNSLMFAINIATILDIGKFINLM